MEGSSQLDLVTEDEDEQQKDLEMLEDYRMAIQLLLNEKEKEAVLKLERLSQEKSAMVQAQYALAIIRFRNLWEEKSPRYGKDERSDSLILEAIKWLNDPNCDNNLRPLNRSLLLRVQQYDIGGYGKIVKQVTKDCNLVDEVLNSTVGIITWLNSELVERDLLVMPGTLIRNSTEREADAWFLIRCTIYGLLVQKMLESTSHGTRLNTAIKDTFHKISVVCQESEYVYAEIICAHAIYLLMYPNDKSKQDAVGLLKKSCELKHPRALCLFGGLLYDRKNFSFISENFNLFKECFNNLKAFAKKSRNDRVACVVANEYLRDDSVIPQSREEREREAESVLKESGCELAWKDWKARQQASQVTEKQKSGASNPPSPALPSSLLALGGVIE